MRRWRAAGPQAAARHVARGKLLPRDRVAGLLDPGSPFLEIGATAAHGLYEGDAPAAGVIAGIGQVCGQEVMVVANDATVKGGTYYPLTVKKHLTGAGDRGGERVALHLPRRFGRGEPAEPGRGVSRPRSLRAHLLQPGQHERRGGSPQIAVVMGSCTAGGAYVPAMSDVTIIVKEQGTIFLAGPPLVKAATGEEVTAEELGGGDVHTRLSGVADYLAEDDAHALALARRAVAGLNRARPAGAGASKRRRSRSTTRRRSSASCRRTCGRPTTSAR